MISESEILYLNDGINQGIRADGRTCDAIRPMDVDLGIVPTANGSCRIRSRTTDIYVAIKCDIGKPSVEKPDEGIINVALEFGCSVLPRLQDFTGRQAVLEADAFAEVVADHVESLCLKSLDRKQFCIESGRCCWVASIDILVERIDGCLIDPISIGIRAALMDLELPLVALPPPEDTMDGGETSMMPKVDLLGGLWKLSSSQMSAVCVSIGVFNNNSVILVDMDRMEEYLAKSRENSLITVSVNDQGDVCGIHKWGIGAIDPFVIRDVVSSGIKVGRDISQLMTKLGSNLT